MASISFWAASTASICLSVSAICLMAGTSAAGGGAAWAGAACLACASTSLLETADIANARQAAVKAKAAGRKISRMKGSLGRGADGSSQAWEIWRQNMAEEDRRRDRCGGPASIT